MKKVILFGDSITDMIRWRDDVDTSYAYGFGYGIFLKEMFIRNHKDVELINKGCSGDSTDFLLERLHNDIIALKPDIVTILIGTNDVWHLLQGDDTHHGNSLENYIKNYLKIIHTIKEELPSTRIIMLEPFFLKMDNSNDELFNHLKSIYEYAKAAKQIANDEGLEFIQLQEKMKTEANNASVREVLQDGIHPNVRGSLIIADSIYNAIEKYLN